MSSKLRSPFSTEDTLISSLGNNSEPGVPGFIFLSQPQFDSSRKHQRGHYQNQQHSRGFNGMRGSNRFPQQSPHYGNDACGYTMDSRNAQSIPSSVPRKFNPYYNRRGNGNHNSYGNGGCSPSSVNSPKQGNSHFGDSSLCGNSPFSKSHYGSNSPKISDPNPAFSQYNRNDSQGPNLPFSSPLADDSSHSFNTSFGSNFSGCGRRGAGSVQRGRGAHNTPLSHVPVDKFVSKSMLQDPWDSIVISFTLEEKVGFKEETSEYNCEPLISLATNQVQCDSVLQEKIEDSTDAFSGCWQ